MLTNDLRLNRRALLTATGLAAAATTLPGCVTRAAARLLPPEAEPAPAALLDAIAWNLLAHHPEDATSKGVDTGAHADLRRRLEDRSGAGQAALAETLRRDLARVATVDPSGLDPATRTSFDVVKSAYRTALDGFALPYGDIAVGGWRNAPYVVIQNVGAYIDTPRFLDSDPPVRNAADAEAYLARLEAMAGQLDGELGRMRDAAGKGVIPPDFLIDKALAQMDATIAEAARGGALVDSLVTRARDIPGAWSDRARRIVASAILPALQRQRGELAAQRQRAKNAPGLWAQPDGERWYAWALRASTTTTRSAEEIHALGLEELAALHARMDPLLKDLGYARGSIGARMAALGKDRRYLYPAGDAGRAEILKDMQGKIDWLRPRLPDAFRTLVAGRVEIRRLPAAEESGGPRAYGGPGSIDGTMPGKIWVNLGDTSRHNRFSLPSLTFHEGLPGHVWQGEYEFRLPLVRSVIAFNPYSEGWALYAEQLADELGAYERDPAGRLGFLQNLAWRAGRMVVDTGLHARRWSRPRAVAWYEEVIGLPRAEIAAEIDRYCSWPGQACGYKMGHSEILRQRARAQQRLGPRFDLRDFDDAVVLGGNVPLDVLAQNVERYVDKALRTMAPS